MLAGFAKVVSIYEELGVVIERLIVRTYVAQQWGKHAAWKKTILLYTYPAVFVVKQHKETSVPEYFPEKLGKLQVVAGI